MEEFTRDESIAASTSTNLLPRADVAFKVMSDASARFQVNHAQNERHRQAREDFEETSPVAPAIRHIDRAVEFLDLVTACLRRPEPAQRARLIEIRDNLIARIAEAEQEGWLGEVEGLQVSLAGVEEKLRQIDAEVHRRTTAVDLGMPLWPERHPSERSTGPRPMTEAPPRGSVAQAIITGLAAVVTPPPDLHPEDDRRGTKFHDGSEDVQGGLHRRTSPFRPGSGA
ncbi:DUF6192 family protein [Streptomyces sp. 184]|uniref:DUF6192 family protein n=1 Tax=Streptomyces sp. 184 TaxID=1827526 RepID=UPI0038925EAC